MLSVADDQWTAINSKCNSVQQFAPNSMADIRQDEVLQEIIIGIELHHTIC